MKTTFGSSRFSAKEDLDFCVVGSPMRVNLEDVY